LTGLERLERILHPHIHATDRLDLGAVQNLCHPA
jgi:hypothetical protein